MAPKRQRAYQAIARTAPAMLKQKSRAKRKCSRVVMASGGGSRSRATRIAIEWPYRRLSNHRNYCTHRRRIRERMRGDGLIRSWRQSGIAMRRRNRDPSEAVGNARYGQSEIEG